MADGWIYLWSKPLESAKRAGTPGALRMLSGKLMFCSLGQPTFLEGRKCKSGLALVRHGATAPIPASGTLRRLSTKDLQLTNWPARNLKNYLLRFYVCFIMFYFWTHQYDLAALSSLYGGYSCQDRQRLEISWNTSSTYILATGHVI